MNNGVYETIIIGAGIAGCTAAIYASRKKMNFLLIAKEFGGQFYESGEISNYPGIVTTDGVEFSKKFWEQLAFNGIAVQEEEEVTEITAAGDVFDVISDKNAYKTKTVIIATGSHPRKLNIPGEQEFARRGVTYCSICDGPIFKNKIIAIIGGGNSALEAVDFTKKIVKKIYLINNDKQFNAFEALIEKAVGADNVEIIHEAHVTRIKGERLVNGIVYEKQGKEQELAVEGVIIEIGRMPNTHFVEGFLALTQTGHITIDCQGRTSREGIFAAGDCASGQEYQYAIAAGQGCIALLKAARYLAGKR